MADELKVCVPSIDWSADDNVGPIYRKRPPTVADYDEVIRDLQAARNAIAANDHMGCAVCHDGHDVRHCHHNALVAARAWVEERGKHRCYHCGYVALTDEQAQEHFGRTEHEVAKCIREQVRTPSEPASHIDEREPGYILGVQAAARYLECQDGYGEWKGAAEAILAALSTKAVVQQDQGACPFKPTTPSEPADVDERVREATRAIESIMDGDEGFSAGDLALAALSTKAVEVEDHE